MELKWTGIRYGVADGAEIVITRPSEELTERKDCFFIRVTKRPFVLPDSCSSVTSPHLSLKDNHVIMRGGDEVICGHVFREVGKGKGKNSVREFELLDEEWAQQQQGKGVGKGPLAEMWRTQQTKWVAFPEVIFPVEWYAEVVIPEGGMEMVSSQEGGSKKREHDLHKRYRMSASVRIQ